MPKQKYFEKSPDKLVDASLSWMQDADTLTLEEYRKLRSDAEVRRQG